MATKQFYFSGLIKWAKRQKDDRYNNWTINLYPDKDSLQAIKASGLSVRPKEDDDGTYFTFRRADQKEIKGEMVEFGPPDFKILKGDKAEDFDGLIGNGSEGVVKVDVFDVPRTGGKGHRYQSVLVRNLVEYNPPEPAGDSKAIPGLAPAVPF